MDGRLYALRTKQLIQPTQLLVNNNTKREVRIFNAVNVNKNVNNLILVVFYPILKRVSTRPWLGHTSRTSMYSLFPGRRAALGSPWFLSFSKNINFPSGRWTGPCGTVSGCHLLVVVVHILVSLVFLKHNI